MQAVALFPAEEIALGGELLYVGSSYETPALFQIVAVFNGYRRVNRKGAGIKSVLADRVVLKCEDDLRVLQATYVINSARWQLPLEQQEQYPDLRPQVHTSLADPIGLRPEPGPLPQPESEPLPQQLESYEQPYAE